MEYTFNIELGDYKEKVLKDLRVTLQDTKEEVATMDKDNEDYEILLDNLEEEEKIVKAFENGAFIIEAKTFTQAYNKLRRMVANAGYECEVEEWEKGSTTTNLVWFE